MHTPDQARELWCPMVRIARHEVTEQDRPVAGGIRHLTEQHHIVGGCNTDALGRMRVPASCGCIADKCAMWRWAPVKDEPSWRTVGYCGIAGRPEVTS